MLACGRTDTFLLQHPTLRLFQDEEAQRPIHKKRQLPEGSRTCSRLRLVDSIYVDLLQEPEREPQELLELALPRREVLEDPEEWGHCMVKESKAT